LVNPLPTIFHITHWKAGSQWVYAFLRESAPRRVVAAKSMVGHFYKRPLFPGRIYPTVYSNRSDFDDVFSPGLNPSRILNWYFYNVRKHPIKKFLVIRDLRDTLISLYFSLKVSHKVLYERMADTRRMLEEEENETAFINLIHKNLKRSARIQNSWLSAWQTGEVLLVKYEDLVVDEQKGFLRIAEHCELDVPAAALHEIVLHNSFTSISGRKPGEEDVTSHYRKGVIGDWKNHFTDRIKTEFKEQFGQLLITTGYEKDLNW